MDHCSSYHNHQNNFSKLQHILHMVKHGGDSIRDAFTQLWQLRTSKHADSDIMEVFVLEWPGHGSFSKSIRECAAIFENCFSKMFMQFDWSSGAHREEFLKCLKNHYAKLVEFFFQKDFQL